MTTSISGTSGITFPNGSNQDVGALGVGQTWQNVTASRALGTTYTNDTGKPIVVQIGATGNGEVRYAVVGGVSIAMLGGYANCSMWGQVIVPAGASYMLPTGITLVSWVELR